MAVLAACGGNRDEAEPASASPSVPVSFALPDFSLTDQAGENLSLGDLAGRVWIADFIFTRCAGTCPMQTAEKAKLQPAIAALPGGEDARLVTFTVEPEHDTPEVLKAYAETHGADLSRWSFLTGARGDLWNLSANGFKLAVAEDAKNAAMPILHSSHFALVDRLGRVRGLYNGLEQSGRDELMRDLALVLAEPTEAAPEKSYKKLPYPEDVENPAWLAARAQLQIAGAGRIGAFHDFKFTDVVEQSGITFENRIVDDAGKYHKAVHYDHGNGLAVADVDGDGLSDLYFTTQIGGNELWRNAGGGRFENITTPAIALADKISVAASFADTDNDGDPDLFVTTVRA